MEANPLNGEATWGRLSNLARSMILHVVYSDSKWLKHLEEGEVTFVVHNSAVHSMTPAPSLKAGHGLPSPAGRRRL